MSAVGNASTGGDPPVLDVLLVDDQALVAEAIRRCLAADTAMALHYCADPAQAVEVAGQLRPLVILQDLVMPGIDGLDLVSRYRECPATRDTPVIVLSTKEDAATKKDAFSRGANDYLIKLPDPLELVARLRYHAQAYLSLRRLNAAYEDLHASELRLRQIIMHNADGMLVIDPQRSIRFANPAAESLFGRTVEQLIGTVFEAAADENNAFEISILQLGQGALTVEVRSVATQWEGQPAKLVSLRDVTERKRMELQLQQTRKLESIGQLAAGIAHEINTPAQYVLDNVGFLHDACGDLLAVCDEFQKLLGAVKDSQLSPDQLSRAEQSLKTANYEFLSTEVPAAIAQSREGIRHIAKIVQAMKDFSRPSTDVKAPANLNQALETTLTISHHQWAAVAEVALNLQQDLPLVPCLPGEVNQVFLNVLVNAAQAVADKLKDSGKKGVIGVSTIALADRVQIRISDTGNGIPEKIRDRVFDPFVTTRDVGEGTGQGLAVARSIMVDRHGGTIEFETEAGKGTTFILSLPL